MKKKELLFEINLAETSADEIIEKLKGYKETLNKLKETVNSKRLKDKEKQDIVDVCEMGRLCDRVDEHLGGSKIILNNGIYKK